MKEREEIIQDLKGLDQIDFSKLSFDNVEELDEVVTPGNGCACCCL